MKFCIQEDDYLYDWYVVVCTFASSRIKQSLKFIVNYHYEPNRNGNKNCDFDPETTCSMTVMNKNISKGTPNVHMRLVTSSGGGGGGGGALFKRGLYFFTGS